MSEPASDPAQQQPRFDSQQTEILGRAALAVELMGDGLEVATPDRDLGIDLIAYTIDPWRAMPIQLKVATITGFSVDRKYERIENLAMVYVWNARKGVEAEFYAMRWVDALHIAEALGWTSTKSWNRQRGGGYATTRPSAKVLEAIAPYRMAPGGWRALLETRGR